MRGGCLCGQVRYEVTGEPTTVGVCHCKHCQRQTGSAFSLLVAVPKAAFRPSGTLKTFHDTGESGQPVSRNFCPACGSPIASDVAVMPELTWIKAGTLDDPSWLQPTLQIYCDSAQSWVKLAGLKSFPRMPR